MMDKNKEFSKAKITVTILSDTSVAELASLLEKMTLADISLEIESGDSIGDWEIDCIESVSPDAIRDELLRINNDGTFFDSHIEAEDEPEEEA